MWMADHIWDIWATTGFPWILEWFPFTWIQNSPKCTYICTKSSLHTHNTLRVISYLKFHKSLMKYPKHCRLLFQFAHRLFLDIIFSPSKQHPWTRKEKLLSKNVHVRSHGRSAKFHQHGTPWQKPHPHPMMFDYALRLQNGEKVKKRVSCVSSPDNTSFHVRFC